ncbi:MAG: hypothetical protein GY725_00570 [bacterium]|nr:hypothetical protein [bacterium]
MKLTSLVSALILVCALTLPASAKPRSDYNPRHAGHPLRVVAYALHPVGVVLDYLIFRPAWYIGGVEPFRTLVGRDLEEVRDDAEPIQP